MTVAEQLLESFVNALDSAFISSWQSSAHWQKELDEARQFLEQIKEAK